MQVKVVLFARDPQVIYDGYYTGIITVPYGSVTAGSVISFNGATRYRVTNIAVDIMTSQVTLLVIQEM